MTRILTALGLTTALFTATAFAATPTFTQADANGDGVLNMEEVKAALPEVEDAAIVAADADQSGSISEEEYNTLAAG